MKKINETVIFSVNLLKKENDFPIVGLFLHANYFSFPRNYFFKCM